jgi:hypothetical protein
VHHGRAGRRAGGAGDPPRRPLGLRVGLDFWLAAVLLRLAGPLSWQRIAAAAAISSLRIALARRLRPR